jgi:riboflavin synthase
MFTGIVEGMGLVTHAEFQNQSLRLGVDLLQLADGVGIGDSIAVRGCCLTVEALAGTVASFHLMGETLRMSRFADVAPGHLLNLERSLRVGDRLGGHFVTGHLDGVGPVAEVSISEGQTDLTVELPPSLSDLVIPKGSIALDGVSLTIAHLLSNEVTVCLIPHTVKFTTLGQLRKGDFVHLEMDSIGKWVKRLMP